MFIRWSTLKGIIIIILFIIAAALAEYLIVLYAISLGVKDEAPLLWSFSFPGTEFTFTFTISPLFHLVPLAVIISLLFNWSCLTKYAAVRPIKMQKGKTETISKHSRIRRFKTLKKSFGKIKSGLFKVKGIAFLWQKVHFARVAIESAVIVLLIFLIFAIAVSLLAHPKLIYLVMSEAYKNNPSLLNFVTNTLGFFAPLGRCFSGMDEGLRAAAPIIRDFVSTLSSLTKPLVDLDNSGKYLVFQNAAAWVSALATLFYGEFRRRSYRYKK
jgi:hypothetical protein